MARAYRVGMDRAVTVACVQAEPVVLDRERTIDRLETLAAEAARSGAELVVFPETFVPVYPSSRWAKAFAGWENDAAKQTFARMAENSVAIGSPAERRLGACAQELGIWLVTGVNEVEPDRPGTIYNALLYHAPDGTLALHHRKLVPTNHERLVWGQGDGRGLTAVETGFGRIGGLICWENYMPLARFALYEAGVEIYIASTADDGDAWQSTLVHIARESRAYVVSLGLLGRGVFVEHDLGMVQRVYRVEVLAVPRVVVAADQLRDFCGIHRDSVPRRRRTRSSPTRRVRPSASKRSRSSCAVLRPTPSRSRNRASEMRPADAHQTTLILEKPGQRRIVHLQRLEPELCLECGRRLGARAELGRSAREVELRAAALEGE